MVFSYFAFSGRDSQGFSTYKDVASSEFLSKDGKQTTVKSTAEGEEPRHIFRKHSKVALKLFSDVFIRKANTYAVSHRVS